MDREPNGTADHKNGFSHWAQLSMRFVGSIASLAAGSLCIALVVMYQQDRATLIVMACSNMLYGLGFLAICLMNIKHTNNSFLSLSRLTCICIELVTLGAAVCHFKNERKQIISPNSHLHQNIAIALDSLLLFAFFINGMAITSLTTRADARKRSVEDTPQLDCESAIQNGRFVPLKNSSQTLTPSMEIFQNIQSQCGSKLWSMRDVPTTHSSDDISFPSVVKHKLEAFSSRETSPGSSISRKTSSIKSRLRSSSGSSSPRKNHSIMSRLRSRKQRSNFDGRKKKVTSEEEPNKNISGRYVTRLSTIPDLSKSVLNVILSASDGQHRQEKAAESSIDQNMQHSAILPDPALEMEIDAIERINSALLPPCLRVMETPPPRENVNMSQQEFVQSTQFNGFNKDSHSTPDTLDINGLGEIPQIPAANHDGSSGCSTDFDMHADFPQLVTMDMWRENKDKILERADQLQRQVLLPAFDLGSHKMGDQSPELPGSTFSFPSKSYPTNLNPEVSANQKDFDTISALEEYFRDLNEHEEEESQIIEDGLKHDLSSSVIAGNLSKEIIRTSTRHSPTKSMISTLSAASQQRYMSATGDQRPQSQSNIFLPTSSNGILNASVKSSPTRSQRLKRIGKKLSLSNISDTVANHSITSETTGDLFGTSKHDHLRGRSIDFSYVHTLQNNHSPTKSTSGQSITGSILHDRRHSLAADHGGRTTSGLFFPQSANSTVNLGTDPAVNRTWNEPLSEAQSISHSASTEPSNGSTTDYPDVVMSEYDRERWNAILNLGPREEARA